LEEDSLMFFVLSKAIAFLLLPSNLLMLIGLAGVVLLATRWRRAGLRLAVASLVLMLAAAFLPIGNLLLHALEARFPRWDPSHGAPDGIVVLGGGISPELSFVHGEPVVGSDAGRIIALAKLAHAYPNARIVYTGGDASLLSSGFRETAFLGPLLDVMGVARAQVMREDRARNTAENAVFTKELVKPKPGERWLLVTSAWHMPRAVGCFRRAGFPVEAYPVSWRTGVRPSFWPGDDFGGGLARLDLAAHEWMGIVVYWITGRTSALLPSP
jgi:uncharacterized SAM-binding protein YcdF (DUF218 family)